MPAFGPCRRACGCAGLFFCRRTPLSCLSSPHRSLPRLSSRLPSFSCRPASPQLCRFVLRRLYSVWFFFCHFLFFRSSSIARRLLSVARCAVHRPALAACCPSPIVYPLPPIARNLPPAVHRLLRRPYPVAFICTPSPRRASFRCRSVRITAFVSAESRPACLRELLAVSFRSGFRRSVFPQKYAPPSVPWSPRRF